MTSERLHPNGRPAPGSSRGSQRRFSATRQDPLTGCDDDDFNDCEGDPVTGQPIWDPFEFDDDEDSQPEYGDFWDDSDDFDD